METDYSDLFFEVGFRGWLGFVLFIKQSLRWGENYFQGLHEVALLFAKVTFN